MEVAMSTMNEKIIRGYMTKELAMMYQVSPKVFRMWIKPHLHAIGERQGWYYTSAQVKIIFERLGPPPCEDIEN